MSNYVSKWMDVDVLKLLYFLCSNEKNLHLHFLIDNAYIYNTYVKKELSQYYKNNKGNVVEYPYIGI